MQRLVVLARLVTVALVVAFTGAAGWNVLFAHAPRQAERAASMAFDDVAGENALIRRSVRPSAPPRRLTPARSRQVLTAQRQLARLGFYHGRPDGVPGPATRAALRAFQGEVGLPRSGRIDQATLDRLRYELYLRALAAGTGSVSRP